MKILKYFTKVFWILIFGVFMGNYAQDELTQEIPSETPEESVWVDTEEQQELKVLPTEPVETAQGQEEKVGLTLNIPVIGSVAFYAAKDPQSGEEILQASLPGKSINLSPIPIYFDNFELMITADKNLSANSNVRLFGKKAKLELLEAKKTGEFTQTPILTKAGKKVEALIGNISHIKFRILFEEKPSFTLFPGKSIDLKYVDLVLEIGKKFPVLETEINMFGQPVHVQFGFTTDSASVNFSLSNVLFLNIIPYVKDTPLAKSNLKLVNVSSKYLFAKKGNKVQTKAVGQQAGSLKETEEELLKASMSTDIGSPGSLSLSFSAHADFSDILDDNLKKYINLNNLIINAAYSQAEGFHLESSINDFGIPVVGNISEAKLMVDWAKKAPVTELEKQTVSKSTSKTIKKNIGEHLTIAITGSGAFNIPVSGLSGLKYVLDAQYINKEFIFGGKLSESFSYASINIAADAEFTANIAKKSIVISGNTNLHGLDLIANMTVAPDEKTKETTVSFKAEAKAADWQPLVSIEGLGFLPKEIRDITVKNLNANVTTEKKNQKLIAELSVLGEVNILNIDLEAQVKFIKNENQTGILLKGGIPDAKMPSVFKAINIKDAFIILSTIAYEDPVSGARYQKGLNLAGEFDFTSGGLKTLSEILHIDRLNIVGSIDPTNLRNSKFYIQLPGINTGLHVFTFGPLALEVSAEPSIKLLAEVIVRPDKSELVFRGSGGISGASIALELNMLGLWRNPFNLISDDFAIGNGTVGFSLITEPPYVNGVKLGGETELTKDKDIKFAISINLTNPMNMALLGELKGTLTLEEFVSFIVNKVLRQKVNLSDLPDIGMQDIKISFAPSTVEIGAITVEQGITLKGMITLFGKQIAVDFEVKSSGAKAQADMSPIELGPLKITAGETARGGKRETKLGGPSIDIELNAARQQFLVSGLLAIEYVFAVSTDISISRSGLDFNFQTNIGPDKSKFFTAQVKGHSSGPISNPDFELHMEMEQRFLDFMQKEVTDALAVAEKEVQEKINKALNDVATIDKQIEASKSAIAGASKNVEEWKNKIKTFDTQISSKKRELDYYKKKISGGSIWGDIGDAFKKAGNTIGDVGKKAVGGIGDISKQAIDFAQQQAKKGVSLAEQQANRVAYTGNIIKLSSEIAALETAKRSALITLQSFQLALDKVANPAAITTLEASKRTAEGVLNAAKASTVGVLQAGQWTIKSLAQGFNIKKIVFDGSLKKIENGKILGMEFECTILGSDKKVTYDLDFKDIKSSASKFADYIVNHFIPGR